ncbi:MAG: hypothetical protein V4538_12240 [Bacteroidota bacterium]
MIYRFFILTMVFVISNCNIQNKKHRPIVIKGYYEIDSIIISKDSCILEGIVFDKRSNEKLNYGIVYLDSNKYLAMVDSIGGFRKQVKEGSHSIIISAVGYSKLKTDTINLKNGYKFFIKFYLGTTIIR